MVGRTLDVSANLLIYKESDPKFAIKAAHRG
jgi:hypothetical protein